MEINEKETSFSVRDVLTIIFRRKAIIIATFVLTMGFVYIGLQFKTPMYEASVKMLILARKQIDSPYYKDMPEYSSSQTALTQSEIVKSNPVIEQVVRLLNLNKPPLQYQQPYAGALNSLFIDFLLKQENEGLQHLSEQGKKDFIFRSVVEDLKKRIKVEPVKDTDIFIITVQDYNQHNSATIANAVSRSYCIFDLEQQLAELQQKYGEKHRFFMQLKDNIDKLQQNFLSSSVSNIEAIGPASVKIIEQATVPLNPTGLSRFIILIVSFLMSLIMGVTLAWGLEFFDTTFKSAQEIESYLEINVLGYIPKMKSAVLSVLLIAKNLLLATGIIFCVFFFLEFIFDMMGANPDNPIAVFIFKTTRPAVNSVSSLLPFNSNVDSRLSPLVVLFGLILLALLSTNIVSWLTGRIIKNNVLVKNAKKITAYTQAWQNLSNHIYSLMKEKGYKSVLLTSALPQEGQSTIISNLSLSLSGNNILVIDANFNNPALHQIFNLKLSPGLSDVLEETTPLSRAIQKAESSLDVLSAGKVTANPGLLVYDAKISGVIKAAAAQYDMIFMDAPHLKNLQDSAFISSYIDGIILVVNEGKTRKEVLKAAILPLKQKKANFIGVILNNRTFAIPRFIYERI